MNLIYLFSISLLTELTSILFETPPNFNPEQFNYQDVEEGIDNRVELIVQNERDWMGFESALFACRIEQ